MVHVPGKLLVAPDVLSRCPDLLPPDDDNEGVMLLSPSMFVCVIDATLSYCITTASSDDLLVLQALQSMNEDILPTFHSRLSDWQITEGVLTYKGRIYVLMITISATPSYSTTMIMKLLDTLASLRSASLLPLSSGGLA